MLHRRNILLRGLALCTILLHTISMPKVMEQKEYVKLRAKGIRPTAASAALGVNRVTAYRWESREDVRANIEALAQKYIAKLPDAIKLGHDLIDAGNAAEKTPENDKILKLAAEESRLMRQAVGIAPSHSPSVVINNLVLGNQLNVLMPSIQRLLDQHLDVIEINPEES